MRGRTDAPAGSPGTAPARPFIRPSCTLSTTGMRTFFNVPPSRETLCSEKQDAWSPPSVCESQSAALLWDRPWRARRCCAAVLDAGREAELELPNGGEAVIACHDADEP